MKPLFIFILLLVLATSASAQNFNNKIDSLERAMKKTSDKLEIAKFNYKIATSFFKDFNFPEAEKHAVLCYDTYKSLQIDSLTQDAANLLGIILIYQNNTAGGLDYLTEANRIARSLNDSTLASSTYALKSNVYNQILNQPDTAFIYIDSAEQYYQKDQLEERIFGKIVKGTIFMTVSAYDLALQEYYQGLDLSKSDSAKTASLLINIGVVFEKIGDYNEARKHYREALRYASPKSITKGVIYHNLAGIDRQDNRLSSCIVYARKGNAIFKSLGAIKELFNSKVLLSEYLFEARELNESHQVFASIDTTGINDIQKLEWLAAGTKIGKSGFSHNQLDRAFQELAPSNSQELQISVAALLYKHFKATNNLPRALYYKEIYSDLKDSIVAKEKIVGVQRIALNRVVRKHEKAIQTKEAQNAASAHQLELAEERKTRWIYISLLIFVLSVVVIYFLYRTKKQRSILHGLELGHERKVRQSLLRRLDEAKANIELSTKEIETLQTERDAQTPTSESAELLMSNLDDRNWTSFLSEFELVYPHFYGHLNPLSSTPLSISERRLCALIKLNLSNKEIAEYIFVSPDSVKKAKNRLFKKFDIPALKTTVSDHIRAI
jgi:DNA-binding CsgD family transcriptional regulator/tetratricopeptide (TPR) repeat protein